MTAQQTHGYKLALITATISGFSVFFNSLAVKGIDPIVHTTIKNGFAGILVLLVLLLSKDIHKVKQLSFRQSTMLFSIATIGGSLAFGLFFTGLKMIGAAQGALIHKTLIVWIALMAVPLLKEKISLKMIMGIALLYGSSLVVGVSNFSSVQIGHGLVFLATLCWAIENIIAKVALKDIPVNLLVTARMTVGSLILGIYLISTNKLPLVAALNAWQWLMLLGVGILLFGYVMSWYRALAILPATVTASLLVGATVVTSVLDAVFISKSLSTSSLIQSSLILTGIYLVWLAANEAWKQTGKKPVKEFDIAQHE